MFRDHHKWFSRSLNRDMELLVFGHGGPPVIVFPTSMGAFFEYEDRGMVAALADKLEDYILNEAVPLVKHLTRHDGIGVTGCSFGGYHAMTLALRHPYTFTSCVTMGGAFDITQFLGGYFDEDCYFLNPPSFLPNLTDPYYLEQFHRNKWVLVTGDHDICRAPNEQFSALLHAKGIPHSLHVWNNSKHDWPFWRPMASAYVP
jgi:esterase/lipase superfamily enzyme